MDKDREKILQGLVEHEGRWIPVTEKLRIVREAGLTKVSVSVETAEKPAPPAAEPEPLKPAEAPAPPPPPVGTVTDSTLDKAPLSPVEKAAFSKFADAMSKDDPKNWHLPGSHINIDEVKRDFKDPGSKPGAPPRTASKPPSSDETGEDSYLEYLRAQRRRTLFIFVGVAVAVLVAGAAVVLVALNG